MILKKNEKTLWGIPYQGSKTKLVERIAKWFPNADHFYDLFGITKSSASSTLYEPK